LSPNIVPSVGNFTGRKDRMLLIFGENFYLWGNSPVVHLLTKNGTTEIRPPNLIWWSENLLECQLPECVQDIEVKVANYDMEFGEGKMLKILQDKHNPADKVLVTNSHLILEYSPSEKLKVIDSMAKVVVKKYGVNLDKIQVQTTSGIETLEIRNLSAIIRVFNKVTDECFLELAQKLDNLSPDYFVFDFKFSILKGKFKGASETVYIAANLRNDKTGFLLLDPYTKQPITKEKPFFVVSSDEDEEETNIDGQVSNLHISQPKVEIKPLATISDQPHVLDISIARTSLLNYISKCEDMNALQKWEQMLDESLQQLRAHKQAFNTRLQLQQIKKEIATQSVTQSNGILNGKHSTPPTKEQAIVPKRELSQSLDDDDDDDEPDFKRGKVGNESKQEISLAIPDPKQKNGVVYWKFFNPGNRTFLELVDGKLQIIGSRRIQMFIELVPSGSKFVKAHLYVQKNGVYEVIEFCGRCKENGIPNVFCILPRRGREHDYPWITFRITCTSTAKHWKGCLFWIGAEFLTDSANGIISKVFSPPIYVQSKVKGKDLLNIGGERTPSPSNELVRTKSLESMHSSPSLTTDLLRTKSVESIKPFSPLSSELLRTRSFDGIKSSTLFNLPTSSNDGQKNLPVNITNTISVQGNSLYSNSTMISCTPTNLVQAANILETMKTVSQTPVASAVQP